MKKKEIKAQKNGTDIGGSIMRLQNARNADGVSSSNGSLTFLHNFSKNDQLKIVGKRISGTATVKTLANACGLKIRRYE